MRAVKNIRRVYITYSVALIVLGLWLTASPDLSSSALCGIAGIVALVCGLVKMSGYFINDTYGLAFQFDFALGILGLVLGVILLARPKELLEIINVVLGLMLLCESAFKLQTAKEAKQFGIDNWWAILIPGALTAALGVALILDPLSGILTLTALLGLALIADGVQNLLVAIYTIKLIRRAGPVGGDE